LIPCPFASLCGAIPLLNRVYPYSVTEMKLIVPLLSAIALCVFSAGARASGAPHYAVLISGVSKIELSDTTSVDTVRFDNTTILKAIVATGSSGVSKASDLDIVITPDDLEVDVINKATHGIVEVLGQGGSVSYNGVIQTVSRNTITKVTSADAFTFSLPNGNASVTYNANILFTTAANVTTGIYSRIVLTFNGGNYPATPAVFIMGSLRSTGKIYHYGG
jgi:hypothetical protein